MALNTRTEWYIREYRMSNGICEKTKFPVQVEGETSPRSKREQKRNIRRAEKNATESKHEASRIVNNNFRAGRDVFVTLTYSDEGRETLVMKAGTDEEDAVYLAARHEMKLCIRRAQYACKKLGVEMKSFATTSDRDGKKKTPERVHHHIIVNRKAAPLLMAAWKLGKAIDNKLYGAHHGDLTDVVEYMLDQVRQIDTEKRYVPSRNLEAPAVTRARLARNPEARLRVPRGCKFIWESEGHVGRPQKIRYYRPGPAVEEAEDDETVS